MYPLTPLAEFGDSSQMYSFAMNRTVYADAYLQALINTSASMVPPTISPEFPTVPTPPIPVTPVLPEFATFTFTTPPSPGSFSETLNIEGILPEPFDVAPPVLNFGTAPAAAFGVAPDKPAIDTNYEYPTMSVTLPTAPALLTLQTINFSGITMPTAPSSDIPPLTAVEPDIIPYVPGASYTSQLLTELQTSLQERINGANTGLPADIETNLWNRAREREYRQMSDALAEVDRMGEVMGYSLPNGVWLDARLKIQTEMQNTTAGLSRDIAIKQAELVLENISKATDSAIQLEAKLIDYTNQMEQRRFEACKYMTEAGIAIYNAKVEAYKAYLDAYKTKVQIYEAEIRAQIALVDVYKAQIEAEKLKADMNTALVQQYKTMVEAASLNIEIYKAELAAIQTKAQIEKLKIEIFGEEIKAYVGEINAYTAQVEAYKAAVQAEATKNTAYKTQVEAYAANVDAAAKIVDANISEFEGLLKVYIEEWDAYKVQIEAQTAQAQAIAAGNQVLAEAFKAEVSAITSYNEVLTKQWEAVLDQNARTAEIGIQAAKMNAELYVTTRQLAAEGAKVGAQVSAQLGAAALNAVHWSSSVSTSLSSSGSVSSSFNVNQNID
jgi:hypothetical protein